MELTLEAPPAGEHKLLRETTYSRQAYHDAYERGVFGEQRVELLRGKVYLMPPMGTEHWMSVTRCNILFNRLFASDETFPTCQVPTFTETSEPEPDLAVYRGQPTALPKAEQVMLVVEVSLTTLRVDSTLKLSIYAAAGHPEYWIVDLNSRTLKVHRRPVGLGDASYYADVQAVGPEQSVTPLLFPDKPIKVAELLP